MKRSCVGDWGRRANGSESRHQVRQPRSRDQATRLVSQHHTVDHMIEVEPGSGPPTGPTYQLSLTEMNELKKQLQDLLDHGFIRPSQSPYGAPVLFVRKKEGDMRMCVDYCANTYPEGCNCLHQDRPPL